MPLAFAVISESSYWPKRAVPAGEALLKGIIEDLQNGEDIEVLKTRFKEVLGNVDASEIAKAEQQLIDGGLPLKN